MDLCYVTAEMVAESGDVCPLAMDQLAFKVSGAAKLAGVANGDQMGFDSFNGQHPSAFLWQGGCRAAQSARQVGQC